MKDSMVLGGPDEDLPTPPLTSREGRPEHGQVRRFRAARGEHDLSKETAESRRKGLAGQIHGRSRPASFFVEGRRVRRGPEPREHGFPGFRDQGRRRRVVKVNPVYPNTTTAKVRTEALWIECITIAGTNDPVI